MRVKIVETDRPWPQFTLTAENDDERLLLKAFLVAKHNSPDQLRVDILGSGTMMHQPGWNSVSFGWRPKWPSEATPQQVRTLEEFEADQRQEMRARFAGQLMAAYRSQELHETQQSERVADWAVMDADALIAALYPDFAPAKDAPRVALKWQRESDLRLVARTPFGVYVTGRNSEHDWGLFFAGGHIGIYETESRAIAEAEEHFNNALSLCLSHSTD